MERLAGWGCSALLGVLVVSIAACGGEVIGVGNGGNRIGLGTLPGEVAEALAKNPAVPQVTDKLVVEIFSAIVVRAKQGDPEAALIVFHVAEQQQADAE